MLGLVVLSKLTSTDAEDPDFPKHPHPTLIRGFVLALLHEERRLCILKMTLAPSCFGGDICFSPDILATRTAHKMRGGIHVLASLSHVLEIFYSELY